MVYGLGFMVYGLWFRVYDLGFRVSSAAPCPGNLEPRPSLAPSTRAADGRGVCTCVLYVICYVVCTCVLYVICYAVCA